MNARGWTFIAAAFTAAVGLAVPLAPGATVAAVLAIAVFLLFLGAPKATAALAVIVTLLNQTVVQLSGLSRASLLDEVAVVLCSVFFVMWRVTSGQRLRRLPGAPWFGLYVISGAISSIIHGVSPGLAIVGCFLFLKGPILAFGFAQLDWTPNDVRRVCKIGAVGLGIVLFLAFLNALAPTAWSARIALEGVNMTIRVAGFPNLIGPFTHPGDLGQICALGVAAVVAYRAVVRTGVWSAVLLAGAAAGTLFTWRRKALAAMIASALAARLLVVRKRVATSVAALLTAPVLILVLWSPLETIAEATYDDYIVGAGNAARTVFYVDSLRIAINEAPFGAGFSRYGSYLAGVYYSPEYEARNYSSVWGLGPEKAGEASFLTDTFWPAILGETGFFGLVGYAAALFVIARSALRLYRRSVDPYVRWLSVVLWAWSVEFLLESVASQVYNSPPGFALLFGVAGMVSALQARAEQEQRVIGNQGSTLILSGGRPR